MDEVIFLYVTAPDDAAAARIAETLVSERHAACVNIMPCVKSVYRWKGAIERGEETAMIVKTTSAKAASARALIERLHPYETPVIAAIAVDAARSGGAFLDWIANELGETFP